LLLLRCAKTLCEAVDVQTDFAKTTFDKLVVEGMKVSEISVKVANEAALPINARLNAAIERGTACRTGHLGGV
jgi:phasin family protein